MQFSGQSLDFYDDPQAAVLRSVVPDYGQLPEFVKSASRLSEGDLNALPDSSFALVLTDGDRKMRKFACSDRGNTFLSALYFMEKRAEMPDPVAETAAQNLYNACLAFEIHPPAQIEKLAFLAKGLTVMGAASEVGQAGKKSKSILKNPWATPKLASDGRHVNIDGMQAPIKVTRQTHEFTVGTAEGHEFPLDDYGQIQKTAGWFGRYGKQLHPAERRTFCVKLASRAEDVGVSVSGEIRKYGSEGYASKAELNAALDVRLRLLDPSSDAAAALEDIRGMSKTASADVYAETLREFDVKTGLHQHWDSHVIDPWFSTYGSEKVAEWSWSYSNDRVTEPELRALMHSHSDLVKKVLAYDIVAGLQKDPVNVFESLPLEHRQVLARLASDPHSGGSGT